MSVKDRLKDFLRSQNLSHAAFEGKAGLSTGFVSSIGKGINTGSLGKIKAAFPELNTNWLQTGDGEMIEHELLDAGATLKKISVTVDVMLAAVAEILGTVKGISTTVQRADLEKMVNDKLGKSSEPVQ